MTTTSGMTETKPASGAKTANPGAARVGTPKEQSTAVFSNILACVDGSLHTAKVLDWAITLARSLDAPLRTLRVLDTSVNHTAPHDPIVWEMRQADARRCLEGFLDSAGASEEDKAAIEVAVGPLHERFQAFLADTLTDLCVIGTVGEGTHPDRMIGDTARRIVETATCSVLIVPPQAASDMGRGADALRRLMVPLDCSQRAEAALPAAIALADISGSEILMAHSVPEPVITEIGPPDEADIALRKSIAERNRKAAERYMSRLRGRLALDRRPIRTLILSGADPRHQLAHAATEEKVDLIVLSAKGAGGFVDQSLGNVADYLLTHIGKPLLIVRPGTNRKPATITSPAVAAYAQQTNPGRA